MLEGREGAGSLRAKKAFDTEFFELTLGRHEPHIRSGTDIANIAARARYIGLCQSRSTGRTHIALGTAVGLRFGAVLRPLWAGR